MQANALMQYQGNEWATAAWIKANEYLNDPHGYKADKFANEVVEITSRVWPVISARLDHAKAYDLMAFILKRHWHYRHPEAKK